jgi:hypothetical protein
MLPAEFDTSLSELLQAFDRHRILRSRHAPIADLSAANHELYRARMRTYRALKGRPATPTRGNGRSSR